MKLVLGTHCFGMEDRCRPEEEQSFFIFYFHGLLQFYVGPNQLVAVMKKPTSMVEVVHQGF
jgi:hypothetical protein